MKKAIPTGRQGFTLIELLVVITIIGILSSIGLNTFTSSQIRSRDGKRKAHVKQMVDALESYYNDKSQYPADDGNGNMLACGTDAEEACTWGSSSMQNTTTGTVYMIQLPADPTQGYRYYYDATTTGTTINKFQLYTRLENTKDIAITEVAEVPQAYTDIDCGTKACNYGLASTNMAVDTGRTVADDPDL